MTRPASQPLSLLWTPSSRSIISSARASASALTSAAGWCSRTISSLTDSPSMKSPASALVGASQRAALLDLDALLGEILDRGRMPRDRGGLGFLVLELDVLGFLVHADEIVAMVEHRLRDLVREVLVHVAVDGEEVGHGGGLVVGLHPLVDVLGDDVLDVDVAVLLGHRRHQMRDVDHLDLDSGRVR